MSNTYKKLMGNKDIFDKLQEKDYEDEFISSGVIAMNLLHKGKVDRAVKIGSIEQISADSSYGKSFIGCNILKNAQQKGMDCVVIDTERGFNKKLAESIGVDLKDLPIIQTSMIPKIKQALHIISEGKTKKERRNTFILFDSWGTLVDEATMVKAADGNATQNMRLPQEKNILANYMKETDMTFYVINGVYQNTGGFGDPLLVGGGKRLYFNSESIVLALSKKKEKLSTGKVIGAIITAETHKGRSAIEKSTKLQFRIKHDGGLDIYYGLLPDALEFGCVEKPKQGWYNRPSVKDDKNWRESELYVQEFWEPILRDGAFKDFLEAKYSYEDRKIDVSESDAEDFFDGDIITEDEE